MNEEHVRRSNSRTLIGFSTVVFVSWDPEPGDFGAADLGNYQAWALRFVNGVLAWRSVRFRTIAYWL